MTDSGAPPSHPPQPTGWVGGTGAAGAQDQTDQTGLSLGAKDSQSKTKYKRRNLRATQLRSS